MTEQWKGAFKTIYGKSPGKADYALASNSIAKDVLKSDENEEEDVKGRDLFAPTRLKRPIAYSPIKQLAKKRAVLPTKDGKPVAFPVRESPIKKVKPNSSIGEPHAKQVLFEPLLRATCFTSPTKEIQVALNWRLKVASDSENPSPQKPLFCRKVMISSADSLYQTKSPVKQMEDISHGTTEKLEVMDEEAITNLRQKIRNKSDTNFLKLNMKKGYRAKGKVAAEQKRKFKRKANFKKFKSGL